MVDVEEGKDDKRQAGGRLKMARWSCRRLSPVPEGRKKRDAYALATASFLR